jgi:hypothetical protein
MIDPDKNCKENPTGTSANERKPPFSPGSQNRGGHYLGTAASIRVG